MSINYCSLMQPDQERSSKHSSPKYVAKGRERVTGMVAIPTETTALQLLATYKLGLSTSLK